MISSIFFVFRLALAWIVSYIVLSVGVHEALFPHAGGEGMMVLMGFVAAGVTLTGAFWKSVV